ncbi:transaldolase [Biscogniauxia mediterranea]|nr:transaldolase [Biscogniauxia mediterranea]
MGSAGTETLLDVLRSKSAVDCDTFTIDGMCVLDSANPPPWMKQYIPSEADARYIVPQKLGPFVDCTSNQAIAYHELVRVDAGGSPVHAKLIKDSVDYAASKASQYPDVDHAELAVETMMVKLALRIVPYLTGYSHIQTNPKYSYSKQKTIENAQRVVAIFKDLDPSYDAKRVCIKIPATWEGLQACRELEKQGIATLATTMFCMEQAALAAHVGCTYIAPYINELRVHFDSGYVDENKAFDFCGSAQRYYEQIKSRTQVLPASLTSIQEVMRLAGAHHITVSPPLLTKLAETPANPWEGDTGSVFSGGAKKGEEESFGSYEGILQEESKWRLAFTLSMGGKAEGKIIQAINIFCEKQDGLEALARQK